jgi:hypothetical protein
MVIRLLALQSGLDMVLPSAGMVELSGIALLSQCRMGFGKRVCGGKKCLKNHLYGTFTAAKEKVVQAGRLRSAAAVAGKPIPSPLTMDSDDSSGTCVDGIPTAKKRRRRRRKKKRRNASVSSDR